MTPPKDEDGINLVKYHKKVDNVLPLHLKVAILWTQVGYFFVVVLPKLELEEALTKVVVKVFSIEVFLEY